MSERFDLEAIASWRTQGAVLLSAFFSAKEIEAAIADLDLLFNEYRPTTGSAVNHAPVRELHQLPRQQFELLREMPFSCSSALNLLALHPALIAFARAALGTADVRLYQNIAWAKYTGLTDFNQPFHMDYFNHTLLAPGELPSEKTVNLSIYATAVSDGHGAIHYVPRPEGDAICGVLRPPHPNPVQQEALGGIERSGAGPMGSVFAYSTDVYHRATNLTVRDGHRYTVFAGYKAARNATFLGNHWPNAVRHLAGDAPWQEIFRTAAPDQLACLDIPPPGDGFWTTATLARAQNRWPTWNLSPWRQALSEQL